MSLITDLRNAIDTAAMVSVVAVACLTVAVAEDPGRVAAASAAELGWDMRSFVQVVRPMRYSLNGRLPLFLWTVPLPRNDELVRMRQDGRLRAAIDQLAERGFVPTVEMGWEWTPDGALAMARTLRDASQPVYLLVPDAQLVERGAYGRTMESMEGPDASQGEARRHWPCLPLAEAKPSAERVRELIRPFLDAGIDVRGVWFDDEALPHPWNGVYEAQRDSAECRPHYPPGALADWRAFQRYTFDLRTRLNSEVMANPVHALFPRAVVGTYGDFASSDRVPFVDESGNVYPPRSLGRMDVLMPSAYANTVHLARRFGPDQPVTQEAADRLYFLRLLGAVSTANANKAPGKLSVPFLSRFVPDDPAGRVRFGMSPGLYRELIRHVLLRGSDGLYLFNLGYPGSPVTPAESFESLEDARAVYDELLAYREFLDQGQPMTYEVVRMVDSGVVWSGLRLDDRCLVRAFSLGPREGTVTLEPFPGRRATMPAPAGGATYIIRRDGSVTSPRRPSAD